MPRDCPELLFHVQPFGGFLALSGHVNTTTTPKKSS
jgi:hypothetical protein